ncbi:MAG: hypothetical protein H7336_05925 [Bacteriovorax sp.]|nr:hypothetical protein [Bacteriovorax sp.]
MIWVCEPLCRSFSHEKVNSGFLYSMSLAYHDEKIIFLSHKSHLKSISDILKHDNVKIENLEYREIPFKQAGTFYSFICYFFQLYFILSSVIRSGENKIFFLSYSAPLLWIVKKLKSGFSKFQNLNFLIVLHGSFENINTEVVAQSAPVFNGTVNAIGPGNRLSSKLRKVASTSPKNIIKKIINRITDYLVRVMSFWPQISESLFIEKNIVGFNNAGFRYLALSPYIIENAYKILDPRHIDIRYIYMPIVFAKEKVEINNKHLKVATFGYGNSKKLSEVSNYISNSREIFSFEIRVIGMDNRETEGFSFVSTPCLGRPPSREEMESLAKDIDFFIILYDKHKYRLSCSGSIYEALSYRKPIIYLDNECINFYNVEAGVIGINCENTKEIAETILKLSDNFEESRIMINAFIQNIDLVREKVRIENNFRLLKEAYTF